MNKLHSLLKKSLCAMLVLAAALSVSGCAAKSASDDIREDFLIRCYTSDYNGRYTVFSRSDNPEQKDIDKFYSCIEDICSEEVYRQYLKDYALIVYDAVAFQKGIEVLPEDIAFESYGTSEDGGETSLFILTLHSHGAYEETENVAGMITVKDGIVTDVHVIE